MSLIKPQIMTKVISGAQTGADLAGLVVAKQLGILTGGTMPKGFRNQDGNWPEFAQIYGLDEDDSESYAPRTRKNVENSDGTLRFAGNWWSPGEKLTLRCLRELKKPKLDIDFYDPLPILDFMAWMQEKNIGVLNVAGNSELTFPGIGQFAQDYFREAILALRKVTK